MKEPKEVGFSFQEIDLTRAQNIVASGDGKYSDLVVMLAQKLPELENANNDLDISEKKGFAFGLPGGKEIDEKDRRNLCHTCNLRLKKMNIAWRISYSGNEKLFICVPDANGKTFQASENSPRTFKPRPGVSAMEKEMLELREQGLSYGQIAKRIGLQHWKVAYHLGKKGLAKGLAKQLGKEKVFTALDFVAMARDVLNYHEPFRNHNYACRLFRNAVIIVGIENFHFPANQLDPALGSKKGSSSFLWHHSKMNVDKEVATLRLALKQKGVIQ